MADPVQQKGGVSSKPLEHSVSVGLPSVFGGSGAQMPAIPQEYLGGVGQAGAKSPPIKLPEGLKRPTTPVTTIPADNRLELEKKAKTLIKNFDQRHPPTARVSKPKKKKTGVIVGISSLALAITGLGVFFGIKLLKTEQSADIQEQAASCGSGCGNEPSGYSFYRPPSTIGPFDQGGKLVLYYTNLGGGQMMRKIKLNHNGSEHVVEVTASDRERKGTAITVNAGETLSLESIEEISSTDLPDCAPVKSRPYYAWGWISVNGDDTCGSGLVGPPSACIPFGKSSVTDHISWAAGTGDQIIAKQCWADTREWPGDYDFNDFFIQFGIEGTAPPSPTQIQDMVCSGISLNPTNPTYGAVVTLTCTGTPSSRAVLADFQVKRSAGDYQGLTNKTDTTAEYVVSGVGAYSVRCRMCTDATKTTCTGWQTAQ